MFANSGRVERASISLLVFGLFFTIYLISYSGAFLSTDERALFAAAEGVAKRSSPTANSLFWSSTGVVRTNDQGDVCANFEPAQVLLAAPLIWLAGFLPHVGQVHAAYLLNAAITAATVVILYHYLLALGQGVSTSLVTASLFGLATTAWPYAKTLFREPLAALALLALAYSLLRLGQSAKQGYAGLAGLALGVALATKQSNALAVVVLVPFGLSYLLEASPLSRVRLRSALLVLLVCLLVAVPAFFYQQQCGRQQPGTSALTTTGSDGSFGQALVGFLFSPGKSLFVYAPVLLAALSGLPRSWARRRRETALCVAVLVVQLVGYAALKPSLWWGGLNWGPRFLVPIVPFLCIPLASAVAWVKEHPRTLRTALFGLLVLLSLAVQLVGVSVSSLAYSESITQLRPDGMWTLALYNPVYSQPLYSLRLFRLSALDFSWVHHAGESIQIDWLFLTAATGVLLLMAVALWRVWRHGLPRWAIPGLLFAALALSGLLLVRRYDDPRFPGGSDYHALVADLGQQAADGDVVVVTDNLYTDFFLNYNEASPDWYALGRAGEQLAPNVETLLDGLISRYDRLWLVMDQTPDLGLPHPREDWLVAHAYPIQESVYSDYCRLLLFSTEDLPDPTQPTTALDFKLGDRIGLLGYDLPSRTLGAGDAFRLSLLWQARQQPEQNLTVFVQLLSQNEGPVWQADQYPVQGQRPTTTWEPGEEIRDQYGWIVPADLPAGSYRVIAGLYQLKSMTRLPVADSSGRRLGEFAGLGTITIAASP